MENSGNKMSQDPTLSLNGEDKELECPVCFEIPNGKIYQCKNGHMICAGCTSKVDTCPQCRCNLKVDGSLIRNRMAESLIDKINNQCPIPLQNSEQSVTQVVRRNVPVSRVVVGEIRKTGSGNQTIEGNVRGNVSQVGSGSLDINGDVNGDVFNTGSGTLQIIGNVKGKVSQTGSGALRVHGNVNGNVSNQGSGRIRIYGVVYGVISKTGSGELTIDGDRYGS